MTIVGVQIDQDILEEKEMQACITSRFNPIRAGFHGHADVWTRDVLNLGVRPDILIDKVLPARRESQSACGPSRLGSPRLARLLCELPLSRDGLKSVWDTDGIKPEQISTDKGLVASRVVQDTSGQSGCRTRCQARLL